MTYNSELPEDKIHTYKRLLRFYEELNQLQKLCLCEVMVPEEV